MQVYVVVYNKARGEVLVAFKKISGARFHGVATRPAVLNYSGQLVFPGGGADGEDPTVAAFREFTEETGVNLRKYVRDGELETAKFQEGSFAATYVPIDSDYMDALVNDANANVSHGETEDDELYQLGFLSVETAYGALMHWDSGLTNEQAETELEKRGKRKKYDPFDKSWFKAIMDHLPTVAQRH